MHTSKMPSSYPFPLSITIGSIMNPAARQSSFPWVDNVVNKIYVAPVRKEEGISPPSTTVHPHAK